MRSSDVQEAANLRSVETRELNRSNPYTRSGRVDKHIISTFEIANQDKSLKSLPNTRSAPSSRERDTKPTWEGGVIITCDESLWDACSLHPRQLWRLADDLRLRYSNKFRIGALKPGAKKKTILS
jgi:hypothetical protein